MVPADDPTAETIDELVPLFSAGDTVVDGGNQHWRGTAARSGQLVSHGIELVDVGMSGGIWRREHGYALMIGGPADDEELARLRGHVQDSGEGRWTVGHEVRS